jgi:DDE superfamily endonuclease
VESPVRGRPARRVRRAGTGKPTAETLHGVPSPTQQIQALDRTAPILPIRPGLPEKATHDYVRHGTTTLFAALEVATGRVEQACLPRHRHQEFLRFLRQVAKAYPRVKLHVVCDNYATHKHPAVKACSRATRGSPCTSPRPRRPG